MWYGGDNRQNMDCGAWQIGLRENTDDHRGFNPYIEGKHSTLSGLPALHEVSHFLLEVVSRNEGVQTFYTIKHFRSWMSDLLNYC